MTTHRRPADGFADGQHSPQPLTAAIPPGPTPDPLIFYVTAADAGRTAFLVGPFDTFEEAEALVDQARDLVATTQWKDTLGAFIGVGVSSYRLQHPDLPAPAGRFNAQLIPPPGAPLTGTAA